MRHALIGLYLAAGALASPWASAIPISAGTAEYVTVRDCYAGLSGCDGISVILPGSRFGGFAGDASSSVSVDLPGYGAASGSVALSGVVGAPILKASASSLPGKRLNTNSVALQRYTYIGTEATTRTFGGTLTYSQYSTGVYPFGAGAGINVNLGVFTLPMDSIEVGPTSEDNYMMLSSGVYALDGVVWLGTDHFNDLGGTTDDGLAELAVTVRLNPGDTVWIRAFIQTPATNGGWVDSSHTFVTGWDNPTALVAAAVAVPEAATGWLAALALLALGAQSRRRRLR